MEQNVNLAGTPPRVAHTTEFWSFSSESLALSLFQKNLGGATRQFAAQAATVNGSREREGSSLLKIVAGKADWGQG